MGVAAARGYGGPCGIASSQADGVSAPKRPGVPMSLQTARSVAPGAPARPTTHDVLPPDFRIATSGRTLMGRWSTDTGKGSPTLH